MLIRHPEREDPLHTVELTCDLFKQAVGTVSSNGVWSGENQVCDPSGIWVTETKYDQFSMGCIQVSQPIRSHSASFRTGLPQKLVAINKNTKVWLLCVRCSLITESSTLASTYALVSEASAVRYEKIHPSRH